jgi:hypothetical protein
VRIWSRGLVVRVGYCCQRRKDGLASQQESGSGWMVSRSGTGWSAVGSALWVDFCSTANRVQIASQSRASLSRISLGLKAAFPELRGTKYCGSHRSKFYHSKKTARSVQPFATSREGPKSRLRLRRRFASWLSRVHPNLDKRTGQAQGKCHFSLPLMTQ